MNICKPAIAVSLFFFLAISSIFGADPVELQYSTYLGGSGDDNASDLALTSSGSLVVVGTTQSADFPTFNSYQASRANIRDDVFLVGMTSDGSTLLYGSYFGGSERDAAQVVAIDSSGSVYLTGWTQSSDLPVVHAYQPVFGGGSTQGGPNPDVFLSRFSSSGSALLLSTFLGGTGFDEGYGLALAADGSPLIAGKTSSLNFPTCNAYQAGKRGTYDCFLSRFSTGGSSLVFSTYLGGGLVDETSSYSSNMLAITSEEWPILTGWTESYDFPTVNPYQPALAVANDAFVSCFSSDGSALLLSTYLGGSDTDNAYGLAPTDDGICVVGMTESDDFPIANPYQGSRNGYRDGFVVLLGGTGSTLSFGTYLGGTADDYIHGLAHGIPGQVFLAGRTKSTDFPVINAYQPTKGDSGSTYFDIVAASLVINPSSSLQWSTYLGGSLNDYASSLSLGGGAIYLAGSTASADFPTANSYQGEYPGGNYSAAIASLHFVTPTPAPTPGRANPWITDYNGDGTSDIAVFREASGLWAIRGITRVYFGADGDWPEPGDYDGDGTTDLGIFREDSGLWAVRSVTRAYFGGGYDQPQPGDYDGDGSSDIGIFRESSGLWAVRGVTRAYFGGTNDLPQPGYYSGNNPMNIALFRPSSGLWAVRGVTRVYFGAVSDDPVPGDYGGDGTFYPSIFRPASGLWAIRGFTRYYFGSDTDEPLPADYAGAGYDQVGIFRPASGLWAVQGATRVYFGGGDDIPVTR